MKGFYATDVLVIAIPPRSEAYLDVLARTINTLEPQHSTQVIFLSSISYYDGKATVLEAENLMKVLVPNAVVLRLGGLMGYDRIAGKYTQGKVLDADSRTHYVHRDDVIGIIENIINKDLRSEVFDVVAPIQSTKKAVFEQNAIKFSFKKTTFLRGEVIGKVLTSEKVSKILSYDFQKEDVHAFWDDLSTSDMS